MIQKNIIIYLVCAALSACTWVKPTEESKGIMLVEEQRVSSCELVGSITSNVKHDIGFIIRNEKKVTDELITLAKNKAADIGADTIVAKGPAEDGVMKFSAYKCIE